MQYVLTPATTETEKIERDQLCFATWGDPLTQEEFLKREILLRETPFSQKMMKTWLLKNEQTNEVLASCETYLMNALVDEKFAQILAIASVFVDPKLRGKGYATELMNRVVKHARKTSEIQTDLKALILYSEVDAKIYERSGFQLAPSEDVVFDVPKSPLTKEVSSALITRSTWNETILLPKQKPRLLIYPTYQQIDWFLSRENFYASALQKSVFQTSELPIGFETTTSQILWTSDHRKNCLRVLWCVADSENELETLLELALLETQKRNHTRCIFSKTPTLSVYLKKLNRLDCIETNARLSGKTHYRSDCLSMIHVLNAPTDSKPLKASDWDEISRSIWV